MLRSLRKRMRQKGIAMVEYAVLLAFVCGVGGVYFSDAGISGGVSSVIDRVVRILGPVRDKNMYEVMQSFGDLFVDNPHYFSNTKEGNALLDSISMDDLLIEPKAWTCFGDGNYYHLAYSSVDWTKGNKGALVPMITACVSKDNKEIAYRVGWFVLKEDNNGDLMPDISSNNGHLNSGYYVANDNSLNTVHSVQDVTTPDNGITITKQNFYTRQNYKDYNNANETKNNVVNIYNKIISGELTHP